MNFADTLHSIPGGEGKAGVRKPSAMPDGRAGGVPGPASRPRMLKGGRGAAGYPGASVAGGREALSLGHTAGLRRCSWGGWEAAGAGGGQKGEAPGEKLGRQDPAGEGPTCQPRGEPGGPGVRGDRAWGQACDRRTRWPQCQADTTAPTLPAASLPWPVGKGVAEGLRRRQLHMGGNSCASGGKAGEGEVHWLPSWAETLMHLRLWSGGSRPPWTGAEHSPGSWSTGSGGRRAICFLSGG